MKVTEEMIKDIENMKKYAAEENWDSYDAPPISKEDIEWTYRVIDQLPDLGEDTDFHITPQSIEIYWGPVELWLTFEGDKTGSLQSIESHDPYSKEFSIELDDCDLIEVSNWFISTKNKLEELFGKIPIQFDQWKEIASIEKVFDSGSFKPFIYFITMVPEYPHNYTGFFWQNFRATYAYSSDPIERSFFQCTQAINTRIIPSSSKEVI